MFSLDAATGDDEGSLTDAELRAALPDDAAIPMESAPAIDGLRIEGGQDDPLVVTDSATEQELWRVADHLVYDDVWAVDDDAVYVLHRGSITDTGAVFTIRAYALRTGEIRWEHEPAGESYPWWVADGRVFSLWTDLTLLAADTGEVLWATDYQSPGFPGMRGVLANDDTVFVTFASEWGGGD